MDFHTLGIPQIAWNLCKETIRLMLTSKEYMTEGGVYLTAHGNNFQLLQPINEELVNEY